ncbi:dubious [Schizosaccharomyces pombe]|uniref:Putative uncharacterized protein C12C2.14c n=1 Tax=Schizosaccharomyces pombe (strain 972 / ATCC 24843) TaxID=284812 RepID=YB6E_SCHPO|nr:uncharacterized protein SPBC12C2.14c [Schizosaccharomyces pombe]Q9C0X4.1 RecName: Full=Putative uncharacterized protein C12C2.14c [Schizosaccharomyces pombe 972h-]CAC34974.1 dubious [Schizosaccharomyces pombe]|eukprot:NP_596019.1 uncharacterized protein SPBC12C2.14c [Schizosaccharomyces pombe]
MEELQYNFKKRRKTHNGISRFQRSALPLTIVYTIWSTFGSPCSGDQRVTLSITSILRKVQDRRESEKKVKGKGREEYRRYYFFLLFYVSFPHIFLGLFFFIDKKILPFQSV